MTGWPSTSSLLLPTLHGGSPDSSQQLAHFLKLKPVCVCVCVQADAEGAGALVVPHALADMGHGLCWVRVRLLFPREVTPTPADRRTSA